MEVEMVEEVKVEEVKVEEARAAAVGAGRAAVQAPQDQGWEISTSRICPTRSTSRCSRREEAHD